MDQTRPKILIVDDAVNNLRALELTLQDMDVEIHTSLSGHDALARLLNHRYAVILLDVCMPSMDGFEAARLIRSNRETAMIPIVFFTALSKEDESVFEGYGIGAVDYLCKPINPHVLRAKINIFLQLFRHQQSIEVFNQQLIETNNRLEAEIEERCNAEAEVRRQMAIVEQQRVTLSRANEELEQFTYAASHDLQQPLRKICSYTQLLKEECLNEISSEGVEYLDVLWRSSARLGSLIKDLLRLSRISSSSQSVAHVDTNECLREALENLEISIEESNAKVESAALPHVMAEKNKVVMLFQNLVGNAIKYRTTVDPMVSVGFSESESSYEFHVTDNGIGIKPEHHEHVFRIFNRLHAANQYEGTGIGLAICRRIVDGLGGQIWVDSDGESGSSFRFTVPIRPANRRLEGKHLDEDSTSAQVVDEEHEILS